MILTNKGQSAVEYILLYAMIAGITLTVFNSNAIQEFLSKDGTFVKAMEADMEYSYRHALPGRDILGQGTNAINYSSNAHPSFHDGSSTRFFGPIDRYPN